ncbi:MAG TPA: gamma-glutamyl-gamma-aminobutyrate hydrolase family protein [Vicinamibacterales bacterium]|nr:gamma-glutamyl-gamma-aminobutyrate hydrolase family protein [Vicinamibacterales bacterium]
MALIAVSRNRRMNDYLESVRRAGGDPVEVGGDNETAAAIVGRVGGVLLTGGGDVDPTIYGGTPHATYEAAEPGRDAFDIALARAAVEANVPLLAICRGMQVLNVAMGGTLVQDIPTEMAGALTHAITEPRFAIAHEVWVTKDSRLWDIMSDKLDGESLQVNSRHHQSVRQMASGFQVSATAPDGVIEAMERPASGFCVAVQWHPENFWRTGEFRPLFEHFVHAANG